MSKIFKTESITPRDLRKGNYLEEILKTYSSEGWEYEDKIEINMGGNTLSIILIFSKNG